MTDQLKLKRGVFVTVLMLFLCVGFVSAVDVELYQPSIISLHSDNNPSQILYFQKLNLSETPTINFGFDLNLDDYVELSSNTLIMNDEFESIELSIKSGVPSGFYQGILNFNNGETTIEKTVTVIVSGEVVDSDIIVFPTSKIVNVQQESEKTQNILISVPANYPRTITINAVNLEPEVDTIRFGDLNLGQIAPGGSLQIPIIFTGEDAQTGSYSTSLNILATDSEGQVPLPKVSLTVQVTAGVTPVTEDTFSTAPTCSLSASIFNVNNTYSFTCSNTVSNLEIVIPSSEYYKGTKVETSQSLYRYDFMPTQYGNTFFKAEFRYNGASIFDAFSQEIKISSSGSAVAGTDLKFVFTPKLDNAQDGETVLIQLVDNKTDSLVTDPIILVNAKDINKTGDYSFEYSFVAETDYELRGKAPGYNDLVQTIQINPKPIGIILNPASGDTSTIFSINTSVLNASLFINGAKVENPYSGTLSAGVNEIEAIQQGYTKSRINLTVENVIRITSGGEDFKKGTLQTFFLNQNASYKVQYQNSMDATSVELITFGDGSKIEFTPDKKGFYRIEADGNGVGPFYEISGFSLKNKWWFLPAWTWILIIFVIIIVVIIIIAVKRSPSYDEGTGGGMVMAVGDGGS